jgi:Ca-activated chloride channel homolog
MNTDLQFGQPLFLWGLLLAPAVMGVLAVLYFRRRARLRRFAEAGTLHRLAGEFSPLRFFLRALALSLSLLFIVLAAAQPKYGRKPVPVQRKGVDLIIALDVSKSMDTTDVAPSRLQRARRSIQTLLDKLAGDRIGLIVFAGEAILLHPLTTCAAGFKITLDTLETDVVPTPGTALGKAIECARESFEERSVKNKVLILITDGESHDEDALEQARLAHEEGILIYTLGIGTPAGAPVPEQVRDGEVTEYKKSDGRYVISQLNSDLLRQIAKAGDGAFYHFTGADDALDRLYGTISAMGEKEMTSKFQDLLNDIYQYPLAAGVLCLGAAMTIGERRRKSA